MIYKNYSYFKNCSYESYVRDSPIVIMAPHSGRNYDKCFLKQTNLSIQDLRGSEDAYVDKIFFSNLGDFSFIKANFPRIFIDVNRSPLEIDSLMWENNKFKKLFNQKTSKVLSGIGVFPKVNINGEIIYSCRLPFEEAKRRLFTYYFPYHKKIREIIKLSKKKYKKIIALDCHSMSSDIVDVDTDIVLSNGEGKTSDYDTLYFVKNVLNSFGLKVNINDPFKGGFISYYHADVKRGINFIQIEINKKLYMCQKNFVVKEKELKKLKKCFKSLIHSIK